MLLSKAGDIILSIGSICPPVSVVGVAAGVGVQTLELTNRGWWSGITGSYGGQDAEACMSSIIDVDGALVGA